MLLTAIPAVAQQSMVFSKPADNVTEKANSFMPQNLQGSAGSITAPKGGSGIFSAGKPLPAFDILPGAPAPAMSRAQVEQWQKFLDGKKKWALMTPEEIMGVPTAEKILGLPEKDAEKNLTIEERYMARQDGLAASAATNGFHGENYSSDENSPFKQRDSGNPYWQQPGYGQGRFSGADSDANSVRSLAPKQDSAWTSAFTFPVPPPKATPEQLAGMERFRELMEPGLGAVKSTAPVMPVPDPYMQRQPEFNPLGRSAAALPSQNIASHPMGITPLPTLTRAYAPPVKSSAQSKLPPWMTDASTAPKFQQRKF